MPRAFELAPHVARLRGDVFSSVAARLPSDGRETWPFHVGDVWYDPPPGCRVEDLRAEDHERLYRYGAVGGLPALRDALAARSARKTGVATAAEDVLVAGARPRPSRAAWGRSSRRASRWRCSRPTGR